MQILYTPCVYRTLCKVACTLYFKTTHSYTSHMFQQSLWYHNAGKISTWSILRYNTCANNRGRSHSLNNTPRHYFFLVRFFSLLKWRWSCGIVCVAYAWVAVEGHGLPSHVIRAVSLRATAQSGRVEPSKTERALHTGDCFWFCLIKITFANPR